MSLKEEEKQDEKSFPPNYQFPKSLRLLSRKDFKPFRSSPFFKGKYLSLQYYYSFSSSEKSCSQRDPRMGLSVSRKFAKAPGRNLFKRRLRELFRHHRHQLPQGLCLHFLPRAWALKASYADIQEDFLNLLKKVSFT